MTAEQAEEVPAVQVAPVERDDQEAQTESRKERKRREAQNRIALFKKQAPIKQEIQQIEKLLEAKETRKKEIESLMADPSIYEKKEVVVPLLEEDPVLAKEIKGLESRWEELQAQLEEIEKSTMAS